MMTLALIDFLCLAIAAPCFVVALRDFMRGERPVAQRLGSGSGSFSRSSASSLGIGCSPHRKSPAP
jgi:hypothetical protein